MRPALADHPEAPLPRADELVQPQPQPPALAAKLGTERPGPQDAADDATARSRY